jgi:hypothetical protein
LWHVADVEPGNNFTARLAGSTRPTLDKTTCNAMRGMGIQTTQAFFGLVGAPF